MTGPEPEGGGGGEFIDLAALEAEPAAKPKLDEIKFEGDDIPEELRGKSAADLLKMASGSKQLIGEYQERLAKLEGTVAAGVHQQAPPPPPPEKVEEKELTPEEYNELYQKDPAAAIEYKTAVAERRILKNIDLRLGTLVQGSVTQVKAAVKAKYADEFELFGDEIEKTSMAVKDQSILSNPAVWDDMISFVRGKPGNFDKLVEHKAKKSGADAERRAREQQSAAAGPATTTVQRTPAPSRGAAGGLTPEQAHAAEVLGMSEEDYIKWSKIE